MVMHQMKAVFLVKSNEPEPPCPYCDGNLKYRDRVMRILRREGGEKSWLLIRRLQCNTCRALHRELPDCLLPYKHYETEVISGVVDGIVTPDDLDSENYPSVQTMLLWLSWFTMNLKNIEGLLRRAARTILTDDQSIVSAHGSLLDTIRQRSPNWLEIIIRIIYNSGGHLPSLGALAFASTSF